MALNSTGTSIENSNEINDIGIHINISKQGTLFYILNCKIRYGYHSNNIIPILNKFCFLEIEKLIAC